MATPRFLTQAIVTKYLGYTDKRASRIKATSSAGSVTIPYECGESADMNHARAAHALALKLDWFGTYIAGGLPGDAGNVYVCASDGRDEPHQVEAIEKWGFTIPRDPVTGESVHFMPPVKK